MIDNEKRKMGSTMFKPKMAANGTHERLPVDARVATETSGLPVHARIAVDVRGHVPDGTPFPSDSELFQ